MLFTFVAITQIHYSMENEGRRTIRQRVLTEPEQAVTRFEILYTSELS